MNKKLLNDDRLSKIIQSILYCAVLLTLVYFIVSAVSGIFENGKVDTHKNAITATLMNGEHYRVDGENTVVAEKGRSVTFYVNIDRGYEIVGSVGDKCEISEEIGFYKAVKFNDITYKTVASLVTAQSEVCDFEVEYDDRLGSVVLKTALGESGAHKYFSNDVIDVTAIPNDGSRFLCWSKDNYLNNGGTFFSADKELKNIQFRSIIKLYANFGNIVNDKTVVYDFGGGLEIEQDCTAMLAAHPRANTLTAEDIRSYGVDCDSRMLAGWITESGQRVGLGSRTAVGGIDSVKLYPYWKEYCDAEDFVTSDIEGGSKIEKYIGDNNYIKEIVIPRAIRGKNIVAIGERAFENCKAEAYYLPDTITSIEDNAFLNNTNLTDFYMSDNILQIGDACFTGCAEFETLHVNAFLKPRYTGRYPTYKIDIYDKLALDSEDADKNKLVVLGGSSVWFGYGTQKMRSMLEENSLDYRTYNLGFNAPSSGFLQYELLAPYLKENDVFVHAPEHSWSSAWYGSETDSPLCGKGIAADNYFFMFCESNWDFFSNLTVNKYANIFDLFEKFNAGRLQLPEFEYADAEPLTDMDSFGRNETGEWIAPECGEDKAFISGDGSFTFKSISDETIKRASDGIYAPLSDRGIRVFVTFAPANRHNLLNVYDDEQSIEKAAAEYSASVSSLTNGSGATVLLTQYDTVYDGRHFYNSDYHLGAPFRDVHTEKVFSALIATIKSDEGIK